MMDVAVSPARLWGAAGLVLGYAALCTRVAWGVRRKRSEDVLDNALGEGPSQGPFVLVAYASQTGQAEAIARAAGRMLRGSGVRVTVLPVDAVDAGQLAAHGHSLWVLSTTGEGDAPDHALRFVQDVQARSDIDLQAHESHVLALGDQEYRQFCAFGMQVHTWLQARGAHSEVVCVDNLDAATLGAWQAQVHALRQGWLGDGDTRPPEPLTEEWLLPPESTEFRLQQRICLNPGSEGGPLYQLDWVATDGELPSWESGDLVSLHVPADPDHPRDYSIASIPADGCLQLLVRQSVRADGTPGVASHWLCSGMQVGDTLAMRVRQHSSFRLGDNASRPLILIGNGSGLAGLLSHIRARVAEGRGDQWLIFGERSLEHDAVCKHQLIGWRDAGQLARLDFAWSRAADGKTYVQDVLRQNAPELKDWLARGAAIYVCGSLQGMGQGVHQALKEVLGEAQLHALVHAGRYRRDVY